MIVDILLILALFFIVAGSIGINRLDGVIAKLLTSSMIDSMAVILLMIALIIESGLSSMSVKLIIVLLFVLLTNPVIDHVITQAAYEEIEHD